MPIFTRNGRTLLFVHVPKAGGTSIEKGLAGAGWHMTLRATRRSEGPELFSLRRVSPQHYHATLLQDLLHIDRFDAVFSVVREPLARFRSEYAMRHPDPDAGTADRVDEWTRQMLTAYTSNPFVLDSHLRPQHEFLLPGAHVYRLEDGLDAMSADLNERYDLGLPDRFPRRLRSGDKRRPLASSAVELGREAMKLVTEFYAADFEELGYPTPA